MYSYRPIRESVEELQRLLEARANPNAPFPPTHISPLRHVMLFALPDKVDAMRDLLLQYGAKESKDDKDRADPKGCRRTRTSLYQDLL